ncbi:unnamed protein product [Schistosoma mattheei]|uniref:Uncharacterized protein n=1 Tax=Schistosoma mattheei TaxID=31246 RepID=A0A183NG38_9TREM|nr:unnamed protein product [Schistosoma mattheei]
MEFITSARDCRHFQKKVGSAARLALPPGGTEAPNRYVPHKSFEL